MIVRFAHHNSGGDYWLNAEHWKTLEQHGWKIEWEDEFATEATKEFKSIRQAKKEFRKLTGFDPNDRGCHCCGQPFEFYENNL